MQTDQIHRITSCSPGRASSHLTALLGTDWRGSAFRSPKTPRRYDDLQTEEREEDERRQRHHAERRAEHAGEAIARLVDDDVAEAAAARDRGDRRRGDDRHGGHPKAGEEERD